jgi:hypothetical protein
VRRDSFRVGILDSIAFFIPIFRTSRAQFAGSNLRRQG